MDSEYRQKILKTVFLGLVLMIFGVLGYLVCSLYSSGTLTVYDADGGATAKVEGEYSIAISDEELDTISLRAKSVDAKEFSTKNKVDINTAIPDELMLIDGMGKTKAESIVRMRYEIGGFKYIEDLQNVSGISKKTFDRIKGKIYASEINEELKNSIYTIDTKFIKVMDKENAVKEFEKEWESLFEE